MASSLLLQAQAGTPPDSVVARVWGVLRPYADTSAARVAEFVPLGIGRFQDGTPFQGVHWIHPRRFRQDGADLAEPSFLMYAPIRGDLRLVGAAFSRRIGHDDPVPSGIGGAEAAWHLHQACYRIPGVGLALADGVDDCRARGGTPTPRQTAMVHVWTGAPSPEGVFNHDNVALPFLAVGLRPPVAADLADSVRAGEVRALAVALAESYGFRLPYAKRIDAVAAGSTLADSLGAHRRAIADLVPILRDAEARGDEAGYAAAAARVVGEGEALRVLYARLAPTEEFRRQLDQQYARALAWEGHRHHGM